jgi:hypothetical protein
MYTLDAATIMLIAETKMKFATTCIALARFAACT